MGEIRMDSVVVRFRILKKNRQLDLDIPLNISANELVIALNSAYELGIDTGDIKNCFLQAENPIALLRGNKSLAEFGIRNGSIIYYTG